MTGHACRVVARLFVGAALAAALPGWARAQVPGADAAVPTVSGSPAVFGGVRQDPNANNLAVSASTLGGFDTNILADSAGAGRGTGGTLGSSEQTSSSFLGGAAQLQWRKNSSRVTYFGNGGGQYRKFFDIEDFQVQSYNLAAGAAIKTSRRSALLLVGSASLEPFYQFGVLGRLGPTPSTDGSTSLAFTPDFQAARENALRTSAGAYYSYQLNARTTFEADVRREGFRPSNDEADRAGLVNLGSTYAAARIRRRLTQNLGARLGYGYTLFDRVDRRVPLAVTMTVPVPAPLPDDIDNEQPATSGSEQFGVHKIDIGLDYSRSLTVARRTSLSFGTGSVITRRADQNVDAGTADPLRFDVNGFANLQRQFLRTWSASLNYMRGTSYWEGFNGFGTYDRGSVSMQGLFADRLDFGAGANYSTGMVNLASNERVSSLTAGAQLRYAFSPSLAAYANYTFTRFELPLQFQPQNLVDSYRPERHGVRVGLTLWLDLLR